MWSPGCPNDVRTYCSNSNIRRLLRNPQTAQKSSNPLNLNGPWVFCLFQSGASSGHFDFGFLYRSYLEDALDIRDVDFQ